MKIKFITSYLICLLIITSACSAEKKEESFSTFWSEFRSAIINDDLVKISELSQFPIEIKGVDDSTPTRKLNKAELIKQLPEILSQPVFILKNGDIVETTSKQLLIKNGDYSPEMLLTEDQARVHQFMFIKQNDWHLKRVYLEK